MNLNNHVYCTNCLYGIQLIENILKDTEIPIQCKTCCPYNPEDSMPYEERINYIEITNK